MDCNNCNYMAECNNFSDFMQDRLKMLFDDTLDTLGKLVQFQTELSLMRQEFTKIKDTIKAN